MNVGLIPLEKDDMENFIIENQRAFKYGAMEEFGLRDNHFEEEGEIISRKTIIKSLEKGIAYRILHNKKVVGGLVININGIKGSLDLLFITPCEHSKGIGYKAWCEIERLYPEVKIWETYTPYFEKRNIHFYVNRCRFSIVEFFNEKHKDSHMEKKGDEFEGMFRFEKRMG